MVVRLGVAWATVAAFAVFGGGWLGGLDAPLVAAGLFAWLFAVILWSAFGVVHEAEELADRLGEPYGTLILTLSIVVIEVALVAAVMLGAKAAPTLGRDTMFAVIMIVMNGLVGLGLILGGLRHHRQNYNLDGGRVSRGDHPAHHHRAHHSELHDLDPDGSLTVVQAVAFSVLTVVLYGIFLLLQTGRHSDFFLDFVKPGADAPEARAAHPDAGAGAILRHAGLLLVSLLPIVLLSKSLAAILDHGIKALGAPSALGGVIIAAIVFTPEGISAVKAIRRDQLQRAINLCLGAVTSTVGLTVPAVLAIGLISGQRVVLGLAPAEMAVLAMTLLLSVITFSRQGTTVLEGAVHLVVFFAYLTLIFSP